MGVLNMLTNHYAYGQNVAGIQRYAIDVKTFEASDHHVDEYFYLFLQDSYEMGLECWVLCDSIELLEGESSDYPNTYIIWTNEERRVVVSDNFMVFVSKRVFDLVDNDELVKVITIDDIQQAHDNIVAASESWQSAGLDHRPVAQARYTELEIQFSELLKQYESQSTVVK